MGVESMTALRKVAVAILSWNGKHHLEICLDALAAQHDPGVDWEILVLDNGSTDGTVAWMGERWGRDRRVRLIESPVNHGFCGGNNRLVAATGMDTDAVALLNNDTRPEPGWLGSLVAALGSAPPDVAAVSGKIVDWAGERLDFGRGLMTFDGHAFQLDYRRPLKRARVPAAGNELPFACGGNMLVRRASFLGAGGFDEDYFAYLEDVDLGWRLWSGGERVVFAPEAAVHHRSGATSDLLGLYNRGFLFERNAFLTAYKNYEPGLWERILPAVMLTLTSRTQALLESNPGAEILSIDPYAGHIANTAGKAAVIPPSPKSVVELPPATTWEGFKVRWQGYGPREFLRRGLGKLGGGPPPAAPSPVAGAEPPRLTDERTVAQLRATHWLLGHLDGAAARRAEIQKRRRRPDLEIFERFPVYLVPTYPGDHALFAGAGFRDWLPKELPLIEARLEDIMEM
jgi:GT2 family glycosyltransferase